MTTNDRLDLIPSAVNDVKETVSQFRDKIELAKVNGDEWVETSPEIIAHYQRKGMGPAQFFLFEGVKVCEYGKIDEILSKENQQMGVFLHGSREGLQEGS